MELNEELAAQQREQDIFLNKKDCFYDCLILNVTLAAITIILFFYGTWWVIAAYVIYLIEVFLSHTFSFLNNAMTHIQAKDKIAALTTMNPTITWKIQCYHNETRTRVVRYKSKKGGYSTHIETYQVRINTHSSSTNLDYQNCVDVSNMMDCMNHLPLLQYCRVYLAKSYEFADKNSKALYESRKSYFIVSNNRDAHYDFSEVFEIAGYVSHICTLGGGSFAIPWYYVCRNYVLLSLVFVGWVIRFMFYKNSFAASTSLKKVLTL